jgi:hypothetical protein
MYGAQMNRNWGGACGVESKTIGYTSPNRNGGAARVGRAQRMSGSSGSGNFQSCIKGNTRRDDRPVVGPARETSRAELALGRLQETSLRRVIDPV